MLPFVFTLSWFASHNDGGISLHLYANLTDSNYKPNVMRHEKYSIGRRAFVSPFCDTPKQTTEKRVPSAADKAARNESTPSILIGKMTAAPKTFAIDNFEAKDSNVYFIGYQYNTSSNKGRIPILMWISLIACKFQMKRCIDGYPPPFHPITTMRR
jgi:hypothetical protein